jgi:hypothetical protein
MGLMALQLGTQMTLTSKLLGYVLKTLLNA